MPLGVTTGGAGPPDGRCGLLLPLTGHCEGVLIDIVVYRGIDEMDAVGSLEVFRSAGKGGIDLTARLVTRSPEDVVVCSYGLRVLPDAVYRPGEADVLLVALSDSALTQWPSRSRRPVPAPTLVVNNERGSARHRTRTP